MVYLAAAVGVLSLVCFANTLLTLGVVRRLREQRHPAEADGGGLARPGMVVGTFAVETVAGDRVDRDMLTSGTVVAFFAPGCTPCHQRLPHFVREMARMPGGRDDVLAVVVGGRDEAEAMVDSLSPVAHVVVEPAIGPVANAFDTTGFPAIYLIEPDGHIGTAGHDVPLLPQRAAR